MNVNWDKMDQKEASRLQAEGLAMLHFCVQIAEEQMLKNKFFFLEHPTRASSWTTHAIAWLLRQEGVLRFVFDQCMTGLSVKPGTLSRKTTAIVTNHLGIAAELSKFQCDHSHEHLQLQNGLPHKAQHYPDQMIKAIVKGLTTIARREPQQTSFSFAAEEEEAGEEELDVEIPNVAADSKLTITGDQVKLLHKMHNNMGHVPREQMMMILKAAGCEPHILEYVRDHFSCEVCGKRKKPIERRKADL